jgi:uncharacterized protein YdaT
MNRRRNQHVVPHKKHWAVKGEGNSRNTIYTETKNEAIVKARQIAKNKKSEVVIHNRNGKISDSNSYGNDPYPPKG